MHGTRPIGSHHARLLAIVALLIVGVVIVELTSQRAGPTATPTATAPPPAISRPFGSPTGTVAIPLAAAAPTMDAVSAIKRVGPAVVTVINKQRVAGTGTDQLLEVGSGTGFIIDKQGHIVTNDHVVAGGQAFEVILADGTSRPAKLLGGDPISDLAVIQIAGPLPGIAVLGDSELVEPGQPVLAIGSPLGTYTNTVTHGIVSGINRTVDEEPGQPSLIGLIQHDAPVNPGNSGGPLINLAGQVIGVNTIGIPEQNGTPVQGIFFAIPSTTVRDIAAKVIATGKVVYPYLGVATRVVTVSRTGESDATPLGGAQVQSVTSGPARAAGIRKGDVILAVDGKALAPGQELTQLLFLHEPGDTVSLKILRGSRQMTVKVKLTERPAR